VNLIFPDEGLVTQLGRILVLDVLYHLFTNNVTPDRDTVLADLTDATWTGYAPITQTFTDYTITGVAGHAGYAIAAPISFSNGSGSPVTTYGYYVTDSGETVLLAAARFDGAPLTIAAAGTLPVVPVWGDFSQLFS